MASRLVTICAWCDVVIWPKNCDPLVIATALTTGRVSHGICHNCRQKQQLELEELKSRHQSEKVSE